MKNIVFPTAFFMAGCMPLPVPNSTITAQEYIGLHEYRQRQELTELLEVDPVRTEWCAAFVNAILELDDIPNLHDIESTAPLMARSFLSWGIPVEPENIKRGDIVIFPRGIKVGKVMLAFIMEKLTQENGLYLVVIKPTKCVMICTIHLGR